MKFSTLKSWFLATLTLVGALAASKPVFADTYQIFLLWSDNVQFYGMDDSGAVVLDFSQECFTGSCYRIFIDGIAVGGLLSSPPSLNYDNGTPCTPALPPGAHLGQGICNNGREAFTAVLSATHPLGGVFVGSYPDLTQLLPGGCCGRINMNALGDIVYDDVFSDYWYFVLDTTTSAVPEPGSIILVGTGVLGALSMIRRWVYR
ncbi:MAG TPA: PEP-CTERM sorting domain-containing protein [Edaphobacter sp.]